MLILQLGSFVEALPFSLILLEQSTTADVMGNLFADDVYVKTGGEITSNYIAPNGGILVTVDTDLAAQNAY